MDHVIRIEGYIGMTCTAETVREQLRAVPAGARPVVRINSDGGSVAEAVAIFQELRAWPGGVTTEVYGWALSSASLILQAGNPRRVFETSLVMVHAPWVDRGGNAQELRRQADLLDTVSESMRSAYMAAGCTAAQLDTWFDGQDHWFTADDAKRAGLVDEIVTAEQGAAALSRQALASCRFPVPSHLLERFTTMTTPTGTLTPDQIRAEALRADVQRRADVRAKFERGVRDSLRGDPAVLALQRQCEDDPTCTAEAAGQRLLAAQAAGTTSIAGAYFVPAGGIGSSADDARMAEFKAAAVDVLLARGGVKLDEPHPAARSIRGLSIASMGEKVLSMLGRPTAGMVGPELIKAAMGTSDFPQLLANVATKALTVAYDSAPATFREWTAERELPDFKSSKLVNVSEAPALLKVNEGAEYTFGKMDDSGTDFQVVTYGRLIRITRQALINDDVDAFTRIPAAQAASAVRLEADLVYAQLTTNPVLGDGQALFHATHGNLGAAASLDLAGLGSARAAMRKQKGLQGLEFIDVQPRFLIVPVALETVAEQLLSSLVDPAKNNDAANVEWVRRLTLVADPRLDVSSATIWYLAASPRQVESVVRVYLMGADRPHLEQKDEFNIDQITMKARHDVGAGVNDFRGLYRVG